MGKQALGSRPASSPLLSACPATFQDLLSGGQRSGLGAAAAARGAADKRTRARRPGEEPQVAPFIKTHGLASAPIRPLAFQTQELLLLSRFVSSSFACV